MGIKKLPIQQFLKNIYLSGGGEISFGERRGAAYGLAGFVKGLGILSLKQLDIMGKLTNAVTDKKQPKARYGYFILLFFKFSLFKLADLMRSIKTNGASRNPETCCCCFVVL